MNFVKLSALLVYFFVLIWRRFNSSTGFLKIRANERIFKFSLECNLFPCPSRPQHRQQRQQAMAISYERLAAGLCLTVIEPESV